MIRTAIVGAGVTGLTAGYELAKKGHQVTLYEKQPDWGGLASIVSIRGRSLERFYHHIFMNDFDLIGLLTELNLEKQLAWYTPQNAIFSNQKLYPFTTPLDLLRFKELTLRDRLALGLLVYQAKAVRDWESLENITAKEWIIRQAGRKVYESVWEPLLVSKFDRDAANISAAWIGNKFKLRASTRGKNPNLELLGYLRDSFGSLLHKLTAEIVRQKGEIRLAEPVLRLEAVDSAIRVITSGGAAEFDKVIVTTAPSVFLDLVPELSGDYRNRLAQIKYQANLCVILELEAPLSKYYWITVAAKDFPFVAVIEHTNLAPWEDYGTHLVYLSRYLDAGHPLFTASDGEIGNLCESFLARIFPKQRLETKINKMYVSRARNAQPVVVTGYSKILPPCRTPIRNLYLADMAQIYPEDRGLNYAIRAGKNIAAQLV